MSKCPNCGSTLTCGCQKRKLKDGKMGCTKCAAQVTQPKVDPKTNSNNTVIVKINTD